MGSPVEAVTSDGRIREYFLTGDSRMMAWERGGMRRRGSAGSGGSRGPHRSREVDGNCVRRNRRPGTLRRRMWRGRIALWAAPRPEQPGTSRKTDDLDGRASRRGPVNCPLDEGSSLARSKERRKRGRRWRSAGRVAVGVGLGQPQRRDPNPVPARAPCRWRRASRWVGASGLKYWEESEEEEPEGAKRRRRILAGLRHVRFYRPPGGRQGAGGSGVAEESWSELEPQQTGRFRVMRRRRTMRPLPRRALQKTGDLGRVLIPPSVKCHLGFVE